MSASLTQDHMLPASASNNTRVLRWAFALAIPLLLALIGLGLQRYPLIVSRGGGEIIGLPVVLLVLYGAAAVAATRRPSPARRLALRDSSVYGVIIGLIFVVDIAVENFVDLGPSAGGTATLGFMLLLLLMFAIAGWRAVLDMGQVSLGIFASVGSAMIGVLIALLYGFAINYLFTQRLGQNFLACAEYRRSGLTDLATFTFYNTLDSAGSHLLEAPIIAAVLGTLASLLAFAFARRRANQHRDSR
jgi:hypothetical protein